MTEKPSGVRFRPVAMKSHRAASVTPTLVFWMPRMSWRIAVSASAWLRRMLSARAWKNSTCQEGTRGSMSTQASAEGRGQSASPRARRAAKAVTASAPAECPMTAGRDGARWRATRSRSMA
ncbi:hypothetical protein ACN28S_33100 [Cystobacter fuscus]